MSVSAKSGSSKREAVVRVTSGSTMKMSVNTLAAISSVTRVTTAWLRTVSPSVAPAATNTCKQMRAGRLSNVLRTTGKQKNASRKPVMSLGGLTVRWSAASLARLTLSA